MKALQLIGAGLFLAVAWIIFLAAWLLPGAVFFTLIALIGHAIGAF